MKSSFALIVAIGVANIALAAQPTPSAAPPSPSTPAATSAPAQPAAQPASPQQSFPQQSPQQPARRPSRETYGERYSILTQRNIFLKDRSRQSSGGPTTSPSATQPAHRSPEQTLLLRGIVVEEGEVRAYFEDIVNSRIVRVAEGDTIARGRITRIGLDALEYEPANGGNAIAIEPTFVVVGHDLTGKVSLLDGALAGAGGGAAAAAAATTGPVMPSGMEGINPNDPNLTMEQRLKLRRMQELKK